MGSAIIYPQYDTYVDENLPTTNFDTSNIVAIMEHTNPWAKRTYMKWDLSSIPGTKITSAILYLYCTYEGGDIATYKVTSSWNSATMTWNSGQPSVDGTNLHTWSPSVVNTWYNSGSDLNALVQSWKNGTITNYGLAIYAPTNIGPIYFSSNDAASNKPYFLITYPSAGGFSGFGPVYTFFKDAFDSNRKLWTAKKKLILPKDLGFSY